MSDVHLTGFIRTHGIKEQMREAQQDPLRGCKWDLRKKEPSEVMLSFSLTNWENVMLFPKMKKEDRIAF